MDRGVKELMNTDKQTNHLSIIYLFIWLCLLIGHLIRFKYLILLQYYMGRCNNKCTYMLRDNYRRIKRTRDGPMYKQGFYFCSVCNAWLDDDGIIMLGKTIKMPYCSCCHYKVRTPAFRSRGKGKERDEAEGKGEERPVYAVKLEAKIINELIQIVGG